MVKERPLFLYVNMKYGEQKSKVKEATQERVAKRRISKETELVFTDD
jgi:hypothetical protein